MGTGWSTDASIRHPPRDPRFSRGQSLAPEISLPAVGREEDEWSDLPCPPRVIGEESPGERPESDRPIVTAGGELRAVGREGDPVDVAGMALDGPEGMPVSASQSRTVPSSPLDAQTSRPGARARRGRRIWRRRRRVPAQTVGRYVQTLQRWNQGKLRMSSSPGPGRCAARVRRASSSRFLWMRCEAVTMSRS